MSPLPYFLLACCLFKVLVVLYILSPGATQFLPLQAELISAMQAYIGLYIMWEEANERLYTSCRGSTVSLHHDCSAADAAGTDDDEASRCDVTAAHPWHLLRRSVSLSVCPLVSTVRVQKVHCGKTADWSLMPFGVVSGVWLGMGVLDGGGDCRREGTVLGVNLGRPIVTNGAFAKRSSQITLRTCFIR